MQVLKISALRAMDTIIPGRAAPKNCTRFALPAFQG